MTQNNQKIPEGWNVKKLGDCVSYFKGFAFKSSCYKIIGTRVIRVSDMGYDSILSKNDSVYVDYQREYNKYILQEGDIIITTVGSKPPVYNSLVGRSIKVKKENNGSLLNQNAVCLRADKINTVQNYFPYLLKMKRYIFYIEDIIRGNANQGSITLEDLFNYHFLLPPLPEQEKIAEILGTWDEAIEKLSNLIEQKKLLKKGLMQKLFNFSRECHKRFDDIFEDYSDKKHPDKELLSATQENGVLPRRLLAGRVMSPEGSLNGYKLIRSGDFVISLRSFQGGFEYSKYEGLISPAYTILRNKIEISKDFYRYFFKSYDFIEKYLSIAVIGIRDGKQISYPDLRSVKIPYPTLEEQQAIADVLSTADDEINLLNQKLEALKEQKKGLMQQLLTGQIRVKVN